MQSTGNLYPTSQRLASCALMLLLAFATNDVSPAVAHEHLSQPVPRPAMNGAIHYQRAILFLAAVDPAMREVLRKPIWEIVTPDISDAKLAKLNDLLIESRHAIRCGIVGANQSVADFGIDLRHYMVSALLPHSQSMVDLARLVTLHGLQRQSEGQWKEAAEVYLATLRMGRHMTHQTTLAEAFAGVEILETAYFALGHWAANCPDPILVSDAFDVLAASALDMVQPALTMQSEANISKMRMEALQNAYPDGAWAEMVLEILEADIPVAGPEGLREAAIEASVKRGIPREAFDSKESFTSYMDDLSSVYFDLAKESALCLTHPSPESIRCGEAVTRKYQQKLIETKNSSAWEPARIAALFAVHEAELTVLRTNMAISAARSADGYPAALADVANKFGGQLPTSPYDGNELVYQVLEGGKGFSLEVSEAKVGGVDLPSIKFVHLPKKAE